MLARGLRHETGSCSRGAGVNRRMLLVESLDSTLFAMQDYFESRGFDVIRARSRSEAEAALLQPEIAIVLIDLRLANGEGRGGIEVVRRARERRPGIPVVLLAWYASSELQEEGRASGADVVIERPCRLGEIAEIVDRLCGDPAATEATDPRRSDADG